MSKKVIVCFEKFESQVSSCYLIADDDDADNNDAAADAADEKW